LRLRWRQQNKSLKNLAIEDIRKGRSKNKIKINIRMSETECQYISSHGILKSCTLTIRSFKEPNIPFNLSLLKKDDTLYLDANLVKDFYKNYWEFIKEPIRLVSGNQDINFTNFDGFQELLSSDKLIGWFSQNMCLVHQKCHSIPIGLDYHTLYAHLGMNHPWSSGKLPLVQDTILRNIRQKGSPLQSRKPQAFCNWHFYLDRGDRKEVLQKVDRRALYFVQGYQRREDAWMNQMEYAFVCSPSGGGLDCHRTWEALVLGCVPIVKSSGMDRVFEGLPVWIVGDWHEVTLEACLAKKEEFAGKIYDYQRLGLEYWIKRIRFAA